MTRITRFDPRPSLIYVTGKVSGPRGDARLSLVLDTGASLTLIVPSVIERIGYGERQPRLPTKLYSALGEERGYAMSVARFATLGFSMDHFPVNVFDIAYRDSCDGLVGLNFLRRFNYQIRSKDGCIVLENIAPIAA